MIGESTGDDQAAADDGDDLAAVVAALARLVADGLGPAIGLGGDRRRRTGVERVARLGRDELGHRLDALWHPLVRYATLRLGGNEQDAKDVVAEAFLRVLRADPDLSAPEALGGYVRATVRNEIYRLGRRDRGRSSSHDPTDLDDLPSRARPFDDRVCDELTLAVAFATLSPRQQQCLALLVEGRSVQETASALGISEGNVKRIRHDAHARLRAALGQAA